MCVTQRGGVRFTWGAGASVRVPVPEAARRVDVYLGGAADLGWALGSTGAEVQWTSGGVRSAINVLKPVAVDQLVVTGATAGDGYITWETPAPCRCGG